jgi:predicted enzyme related to lactoylglutathione lyase
MEEEIMPEYTKHEPGTFSWADLATNDLDAAISLYTDLFGWDVNAQDIPGGGVYAMFQIDGKDVAAASTMQEEQAAQGIPPHWNVYVTVEDAEQAAKSAEAAGGTIVAPAFDVMGVGRMAVLADPTGAIFNVWEPMSNIGAQILQDDNTLGWTELMTTDPKKAVDFYGELFGYTGTPFGEDGTYTVLTRGEAQIAGVMQAQEGWRSAWGIYFNVADVDEIARKTKAAGGQAYLEPQDMPEVGRVAVLADPQGAAFGVVKPVTRS